MPDYGCFVIAWTSYGIVVPLVEQVFGIQPDAPGRSIVVHRHVPRGWRQMSIEALPVGTNTISFAWVETARGAEYSIEAEQDGWTFTVEVPAGGTYYLNGAQVTPTADGIRMSGTRNQLLVVPGR